MLSNGQKSLGRIASHDDAITRFGHYKNWFQSLALEAYTLLSAILQ